MPVTTFSNAVAAYNSAQRSFAAKEKDNGPEAVSGSGSDFAALLTDGARSAIEASKHSEQLSKQALAGKADIHDVVAAVNNAEMTLQTVVAVR